MAGLGLIRGLLFLCQGSGQDPHECLTGLGDTVSPHGVGCKGFKGRKSMKGQKEQKLQVSGRSAFLGRRPHGKLMWLSQYFGAQGLNRICPLLPHTENTQRNSVLGRVERLVSSFLQKSRRPRPLPHRQLRGSEALANLYSLGRLQTASERLKLVAPWVSGRSSFSVIPVYTEQPQKAT